MDIHSLSSKTRDELVSYMEDTRPSCLTLVSIPKSQIKACTHESFNWLDTYSRLLMLSGIPEINFLLTQLIQSKNKMLTANIFLSYRIEEFKAADPKLLQKLKTEFQSFSTEQHSAGENTEVSEALGNLLFLEKSKLSETPS